MTNDSAADEQYEPKFNMTVVRPRTNGLSINHHYDISATFIERILADYHIPRQTRLRFAQDAYTRGGTELLEVYNDGQVCSCYVVVVRVWRESDEAKRRISLKRALRRAQGTLAELAGLVSDQPDKPSPRTRAMSALDLVNKALEEEEKWR